MEEEEMMAMAMSGETRGLERIREEAKGMTKAVMDNLFENWHTNGDDVEVVAEIIRCLRSGLALDSQGALRDHFADSHGEEALDKIEAILEAAVGDFVAEQDLVVARCSVQLIFNSCVESAKMRRLFLEHAVRSSTVKVLHNKDEKLRLYTARLWGLLRDKNEPFTMDGPMLSGLLLGVREANHGVFLELIQGEISIRTDSLEASYDNLSTADKSTLLDIMHEWPSRKGNVSEEIVSFAAERFKANSKRLLTTYSTKETDKTDPTEASKLLDLLCKWSSGPPHVKTLQRDRSILIDGVYLLRMIHDLGKEDEGNEFTPVLKVGEVVDDDDNPVFGFKRNLIRLIGNLCWKHKENQDTVSKIVQT